MSVTLTSNYQEVLAPKTVAEIDRLTNEEDFDLRSILEFIDEHSEEDFHEHYLYYLEKGEEYGFEPVDIFVKNIAAVSEIDDFDRAYIGTYSSPERMAEDFLSDEVDRLHYMIVVDWEATADYLLDHDIERYGDHYFRSYY